MRYFTLILMAFFALNLDAQVPETEVYLMDFVYDSNKQELTQKALKNVSNREGYDNQASFVEGKNALLYVSVIGEGNAEIMYHDLTSNEVRNLTNTPKTSEYSPIMTADGKHFTVVRVEEDGTQRMWQFPLDGSGEPILLLEKAAPVGYYTWMNDNELAMFILGTPHTLQLGSKQDTIMHLISGDTGRCIQNMPNEKAISFVHKVREDYQLLKRVDLETYDTQTIVQMPKGTEDYAWTKNGLIVCCQEGKLMGFQYGQSKEWFELADWSETEVDQTYRIAINQAASQMALIVFKGEKP